MSEICTTVILLIIIVILKWALIQTTKIKTCAWSFYTQVSAGEDLTFHCGRWRSRGILVRQPRIQESSACSDTCSDEWGHIQMSAIHLSIYHQAAILIILPLQINMAESQISTNLLAHHSVPYKLKSWRDFFTRSLTETNTVFYMCTRANLLLLYTCKLPSTLNSLHRLVRLIKEESLTSGRHQRDKQKK